MKVFLIIPTLQQGGAERVISELANNFLREEGIIVHLILLASAEDFYTIDHRVKIHRLGFENKNKIQKVLSEIQTFFRLRKLLKTERPEGVLSFMEKYNTFTLLAASFLNLNVFVSDRSNPKKKLPFQTKILRGLLYPRASGILAQTNFAKDVIFQSIRHKNIKVIPNPIRTIHKDQSLERQKIILNVGRLVEEKGQQYLIEAFASSGLISDWKLVILGEGPMRSELEKLAQDLNIVNRICMPGTVKNVDEWLSKASIFVFPSVSEGFPNALAEAMSAGLPCISFDCDSGPSDLIIGGNGVLIPVKDTERLTLEIINLVKNESLRMELGKAAECIAEKLNSMKISREYLNFILNQSVS